MSYDPLKMAEAVRDYIRRRWSPLPVLFRGKGPGFKGWESVRITEADIPRHFNGHPTNVGVLLGEPSGGIVDVDLDCLEAAALRRSSCQLHPADSVEGPSLTHIGSISRRSPQRRNSGRRQAKCWSSCAAPARRPWSLRPPTNRVRILSSIRPKCQSRLKPGSFTATSLGLPLLPCSRGTHRRRDRATIFGWRSRVGCARRLEPEGH